jgi:hypothetical protein
MVRVAEVHQATAGSVRAAPCPGRMSSSAMLALQRSVGNAGIGRLLQRCGGVGCTCGREQELEHDGASGQHGVASGRLARAISYDACSSTEEATIRASHDRAMELVNNALTKLGAYNGTNPPEVRTGLSTHLKNTSRFVAWTVRNHLRNARNGARDATYECNPHGTARGWSAWCVPFTDIELHPAWFADSDIDARARTMIHEWLHRYACRLDAGYEHSEGYSGHGTVRSLLNADSMAHFVISVR